MHGSAVPTPQILVHLCDFGPQHTASSNSASKVSILPSGDRLYSADNTGIFLVPSRWVITLSGFIYYGNGYQA